MQECSVQHDGVSKLFPTKDSERGWARSSPVLPAGPSQLFSGLGLLSVLTLRSSLLVSTRAAAAMQRALSSSSTWMPSFITAIWLSVARQHGVR